MHVTLRDSMQLPVDIGDPGEIPAPYAVFGTREIARYFLADLADLSSERAMLRVIVTDSLHRTILMSDDSILDAVAEALFEGRIVAHRTPLNLREAEGRGLIARFETSAPTARLPLETIQGTYWVPEDTMVEHSEAIFWSKTVTRTESRILDGMRIWTVNAIHELSRTAHSTARNAYADFARPAWIAEGDLTSWRFNDGHMDALRHSLWNVLLCGEIGTRQTSLFTTAHEGVPGNRSARMAMDLWNNQVGRRTFVESRGSKDADRLAVVLKDKIAKGDLVVITREGKLAWSDQVPLGGHGYLKSD